MFWGKNPWQSHGFPRARTILKEVANDPDRTLVVVDPRRTESAELADIPDLATLLCSGYRDIGMQGSLSD